MPKSHGLRFKYIQPTCTLYAWFILDNRRLENDIKSKDVCVGLFFYQLSSVSTAHKPEWIFFYEQCRPNQIKIKISTGKYHFAFGTSRIMIYTVVLNSMRSINKSKDSKQKTKKQQKRKDSQTFGKEKRSGSAYSHTPYNTTGRFYFVIMRNMSQTVHFNNSKTHINKIYLIWFQ